MNTYNNKYDILASTIKPNPASVKYWADLQSNPNGGGLRLRLIIIQLGNYM